MVVQRIKFDPTFWRSCYNRLQTYLVHTSRDCYPRCLFKNPDVLQYDFKVNSIDYLLKPIDPEELEAALAKFKERSTPAPAQPAFDMGMIQRAMEMMTRNHKERFVVKIGEHIHTIATADTAYFFSQEKATYLQTIERNRFIIDYTLEQLEQLVDPDRFFRINRKYLVSLEAVKDIVTYSNSRLRLILKHTDDMDAIVSRDKVQDFKRWLDR